VTKIAIKILQGNAARMYSFFDKFPSLPSVRNHEIGWQFWHVKVISGKF